jgi:hypothetical protein
MAAERESPILNVIVAILFIATMTFLSFKCRKGDSAKEQTTPEVRLTNEHIIREGDSAYQIRYTIDSAWYDPPYNPDNDR